MALLINTIVSRVFLNFPRNLVENSGNAAWIQIIYGTILAFIAFLIIEKLYAKKAIELEGLYRYFSWAISFAMTIILLMIAGYSKKSTKGGKVNSE